MDRAYGQRFIPTSKCLDNIVLSLKRIENYDVIIELGDDINGYPPTPGTSGTPRIKTIPYNSISTSFSEVIVPFGLVLGSLDPKWIIIYSSLYDPNFTNTTVFFQSSANYTDDQTEYYSYKNWNDAWVNSTDIKLYFKTYKKTYTIPCTIPGCGFTVA